MRLSVYNCVCVYACMCASKQSFLEERIVLLPVCVGVGAHVGIYMPGFLLCDHVFFHVAVMVVLAADGAMATLGLLPTPPAPPLPEPPAVDAAGPCRMSTIPMVPGAADAVASLAPGGSGSPGASNRIWYRSDRVPSPSNGWFWSTAETGHTAAR